MRLKTKLSIGLIFLFSVILAFGILGIVNINNLSRDADLVLKNNHESLVYCNSMLKALENIRTQKDAIQVFEDNLSKQEGNITEIGEKEATTELRRNFSELKADPNDPSNYPEIRQSIIQIQELNEMAILRKSAAVQKTAENAKLWLTIIFTILTLASFTFIFNLPGVISKPISSLSEGITEISLRNYKKRIYLKQEDEFGELADAFNRMAGKLDEYESSNLAKVKFEKSRIETIINQMHDGILGLDDKNNILFLNAVAENLLGLKEKEINGKYAPDIALKNDLMRTLLTDAPDKKELKIYADQKESYFTKDILEVTNEKQVIGKVIVLKNITPFHELNEAKTNFIATVSHELKTPISSIKMSARLLDDERVGALSKEQKELLDSILDDADRLLKITGELLNLAQVETGNIQLKLQSTLPNEIIDQAVQAVQFQAQQKNISLVINVDKSIPMIYADAEKSAWVLINFLTNAIKFTAQGDKISVSVTTNDEDVEFTVTDHGKGIEEKYLMKIFDRYYKVPGSMEQSGTGLGLAISREFIEAQGGRIWVKSKMGEGSEFGFSLKFSTPLAVAAPVA
ncbi:MAG TPA: ATP-binding protein [Puia sp.]|nr:ATP-binding protein [Puia sp.]